MDLAGKVAVVTGGASGIGLAAAKAYLAKGAKVVIADFNEEGGKQAAENLKNDGDILFIKVDVASEDSVKEMIDFAIDQFGTIDLLARRPRQGAGLGRRRATCGEGRCHHRRAHLAQRRERACSASAPVGTAAGQQRGRSCGKGGQAHTGHRQNLSHWVSSEWAW